MEDISFELQQGHSIGISGESGSGKSTLLKLLMRYCGTLTKDYKINDLPLSSLKEDTLHSFRRRHGAIDLFI